MNRPAFPLRPRKGGYPHRRGAGAAVAAMFLAAVLVIGAIVLTAYLSMTPQTRAAFPFAAIQAGSVALVFVMAMVMAIAIPASLAICVRSPLAGAAIIMVAHLLDMISVGAVSVHFGINVGPFDAAFAIVAAAGLLRLPQANLRDIMVKCWLGLTAVWFLLFVVGLAKFKSAAGVEYRPYFYLSFGCLYFLTFNLYKAQIRRILAVMLMGAMVTICIAVYRWSADAFMPGVHAWQEDPGRAGFRVINAQQTFLLVGTFLVSFSAWLTRRVSRVWAAGVPLLFIAIVVLQHRTNWIVMIAMAATLMVTQRRKRSLGLISVFGSVGTGALVLVLLVAGGSGRLGHALEHSVNEPFSSKSTLAWRVDSWTEVAKKWVHGGPVVWPLGYPFGAGWERYIDATASTWEVSPHGQYVTVLARGGLLGLSFFIMAHLLAIRRVARIAKTRSTDVIPKGQSSRQPKAAKQQIAAGGEDEVWPGGGVLAALLVGQMVFYISYSVVPVAIVFVGLALSAASRVNTATLSPAGERIAGVAGGDSKALRRGYRATAAKRTRSATGIAISKNIHS